ncbi:hypothetical protein PV721_20640 [Streptomyces sp. MB09-01]|uniref:hypothetical protein n=1 Tax=Streptomyces sp. MB09-01 TaxID=3028666 RepID=UPI0029B6ADC2|nr:hypothetical protein [Streptomyces sp. MB09-01]MDX3536742.1 hypothetical protein [Streptomyces sp. MB09-01]
MGQFMMSCHRLLGEGRNMTDEGDGWLTERQVSALWPGVGTGSVYVNALAHGVRTHTESWMTTTGYAGKIWYHADDVRRVAPQVAAEPLKGPSQVPCCLVLIVLAAAPLVWLAIQIESAGGW